MKTAETVTFGGGGPGAQIDRAAHLRGNIAPMAQRPDARVLAMWRGRPLVAGGRAVWLPFGHPALTEASATRLFLGLDQGRPLFGADISAWSPEGADPEAMAPFQDPATQSHPALPADHLFADLRSVMAALSPRDAGLSACARALFEWHRTHGFCARCGARTDVAEAGWRRHCPVCGRQHFPRTDPVVIMLVTCGNSVLLGRSPGWPAGMYSLLAGFVEPGETLEAAVRREVAEECAIRVGAVGYLASQPWPFPASLMVGCRAQAQSRAITPDPVEIEDALWISREDLMEVFAANNPTISPARPGSIAHFILSNWLADRLD